MQYGYFDLKNKEYVIDRPDTPAPWVNYLGSPEYGAMISNNAAGYSFVKSGANGRISRFRFNSMIAPDRKRHTFLKRMYFHHFRQFRNQGTNKTIIIAEPVIASHQILCYPNNSSLLF